MENIELKLYTVAELRDWLIHNQPIQGLSEVLISKQRAYSIIMNPYAKDDMPIVSALFVDNQVGAYTACFPDVMRRPENLRLQWCTTLYVNPLYEGRGYAYIVLQQLIEVYGESFFDLDAAEASQANIRYTGLNIDYINQYVFCKKSIKVPTWMPRMIKSKYIRRKAHAEKENALTIIGKQKYTLEYTTYMDDATYAFIEKHSAGDQFLRSPETFTWMLQHGFRLETPSKHRVEHKSEFPENKPIYRIYGVRVKYEDELIGFYILRNSTDNLSVKYLYYNPEHREKVFASIMEHLVLMDDYEFITHHKSLADYISNCGNLYSEPSIEKIAFSHPASFIYDSAQAIQGGDGDMLI